MEHRHMPAVAVAYNGSAESTSPPPNRAHAGGEPNAITPWRLC